MRGSQEENVGATQEETGDFSLQLGKSGARVPLVVNELSS